MSKRRVTSSDAVVLFLEEGYAENNWLAAWNKLFLHLAVKGKGVRLKVRLDSVRKESGNAVRFARWE